MRVLTYNVHGWRAEDGRSNEDLVAEVIGDAAADIVGLNEVFNPGPAAGGGVPATPGAPAGPALRLRRDATRPSRPRASPYGNAVLSRWPIMALARRTISPQMVSYGKRGLLWCVASPALPARGTAHRLRDPSRPPRKTCAWHSGRGEHLAARPRPAAPAPGRLQRAGRGRLSVARRAEGWPRTRAQRGWPARPSTCSAPCSERACGCLVHAKRTGRRDLPRGPARAAHRLSSPQPAPPRCAVAGPGWATGASSASDPPAGAGGLDRFRATYNGRSHERRGHRSFERLPARRGRRAI